MPRLRDYYGPPDFEQKIIDAIKAGKAPGRYTVDDIIEDEEEDMPQMRMGPRPVGGMAPTGYTLKPRSYMSYA